MHLLAEAGKDGLLHGINLDTGKRLYSTAITTRSNTTAPLTKQGTHFCPGSAGGTLLPAFAQTLRALACDDDTQRFVERREK